MSFFISKFPPQAPIIFNQTYPSLIADTKTAISCSRDTLDQIAKIDPENATFSTVMSPLIDEENHQINAESLVALFRYVSPAVVLQFASKDAEELWRVYKQEIYNRKDIYNLVRSVKEKHEDLAPEDQNYLQKVYAEFISNGFNIPEGPEKEEFEELKESIADVTAECADNAAREVGEFWFTAAELEGIPAKGMSRFRRGEVGTEHEGMFKVEFLKAHIENVLRYATNPETRKRFFISIENNCSQNMDAIKELIVLREEVARRLGYESHLASEVQNRMASKESIKSFLDDLKTRLVPLGEREIQKLREVKAGYLRENGVPVAEIDDRIYLWDESFYVRIMQEKILSFDENKVSEFFSLGKTLQGLMKIFEKLFGIVFVENNRNRYRSLLKPQDANGPLVWDYDVLMMEVWNEDAMGGDFLGYLYLDVLSRRQKLSGSYNTTFQSGFYNEDGTQHYPSVALVTSFELPTPTKPTLLRHRSVVVLFHELGHSIQCLLGSTRFARFSGSSTSIDFVEISSQMVENWCWEPLILQSLSYHYTYISPRYWFAWEKENAGKQRPDAKASMELIEGICKTRNLNLVFTVLRQLYLSLFDIAVHSLSGQQEAENADLAQIYNRLRREITGLRGPEEFGEGHGWGCGYTRLHHIYHGYDAGFYTYSIALVYSRDIFETGFSADLLNEMEGRRYREVVLAKGGSLPEMELLKEFLGGRMPNGEAFFRSLGAE